MCTRKPFDPQKTRRLAAIALMALVGLQTGCARVAPYQRETLARQDMELGQPAIVAGEEHGQAYREGSSGGGRVRSGGCGCN